MADKRIVSMLFSDIQGYSRIKDDALVERVAQFNEEFKRQFLKPGNHFFCKTWGDAFFICSHDPSDLADIALNLRDQFRNVNWKKIGFQEPLSVRIGLHAEKVQILMEGGEVSDVIGTQVTSTARIEPIAEPNQVFCSDIFYRHLSNDPHSNIQGISLGKRQLAKGFGAMELYQLVREHETGGARSPETPKPTAPSIPLPRVKRDFTDKEISDFVRSSFRVIAQYFQEALQQLQKRESDVETDFQEDGPSKFSCSIYVHGQRRAQCRVWIGEGFSRDNILYAAGRLIGDNGYDEALTIQHDGQQLYLKPTLGMVAGPRGANEPKTSEAAAEYLWRLFLQPLGT